MAGSQGRFSPMYGAVQKTQVGIAFVTGVQPEPAVEDGRRANIPQRPPFQLTSLRGRRKDHTTVDSDDMLDFHNHLVPGVDDGAANLDESRVGLAAFRSQKVSDVITTPHVRASLLDHPR